MFTIFGSSQLIQILIYVCETFVREPVYLNFLSKQTNVAHITNNCYTYYVLWVDITNVGSGQDHTKDQF